MRRAEIHSYRTSTQQFFNLLETSQGRPSPYNRVDDEALPIETQTFVLCYRVKTGPGWSRFSRLYHQWLDLIRAPLDKMNTSHWWIRLNGMSVGTNGSTLSNFRVGCQNISLARPRNRRRIGAPDNMLTTAGQRLGIASRKARNAHKSNNKTRIKRSRRTSRGHGVWLFTRSLSQGPLTTCHAKVLPTQRFVYIQSLLYVDVAQFNKDLKGVSLSHPFHFVSPPPALTFAAQLAPSSSSRGRCPS